MVLRTEGRQRPTTWAGRTRDLQELARTGKLQPDDLIWKEGMKEWVPADKTTGLFPDRPEASPPPIPESHRANGQRIADEQEGRPRTWQTRSRLSAKGCNLWQRLRRKSTTSEACSGRFANRVSETRAEHLPKSSIQGLNSRSYGTINALLAKIQSLKSAKPEQPASLSAKTKALGVKAKDAAQQKALEFQLSSAFRQLGEAAHQKHGANSGCPESVDVIARCLAEMQMLNNRF